MAELASPAKTERALRLQTRQRLTWSLITLAEQGHGCGRESSGHPRAALGNLAGFLIWTREFAEGVTTAVAGTARSLSTYAGSLMQAAAHMASAC